MSLLGDQAEAVVEEEVSGVVGPNKNLKKSLIKKRLQREKAIIKKEKEIQGLQERLFLLRFDTHNEKDQIILDVKNLSNELKRLNMHLVRLRRKAFLDFESTLDLESLDIDAKFITSNKPYLESLARKRAQPKSELNIKKLDPDEPVDINLMRTSSTGSLEGQEPSQKWHSLFKMFKEWKHQTTAAEATQIVNDPTLRAEEKAKLRAAIVSLKRKKELSAADTRLLRSMQARLKAINTLKPQKPLY
eukprot:TRINITY_DN8436_c0_g1_i1.p1 TRINITY_DN8436_c0_g1~~TRINITY_DN8436_c0_g1_i1.p1  ORF type:complete len:246 (-),score=56.33 TRINITY_DN8436_c0_g1_i1:111-848(-)